MLALSRLFCGAAAKSLSSLAGFAGCQRQLTAACCQGASSPSLWSKQIECQSKVGLHQLLKPPPQPASSVFVSRCFSQASVVAASLMPRSCVWTPVRCIYWGKGRLDITNRRRRMKRHILKKFRKRCAAVLSAQRKLRDKKKEVEFREQLHEIKLRSFGWDPAQKIQERLKLARRNGYYADLLAPIEMKSPGPPAENGVGVAGAVRLTGRKS